MNLEGKLNLEKNMFFTNCNKSRATNQDGKEEKVLNQRSPYTRITDHGLAEGHKLTKGMCTLVHGTILNQTKILTWPHD